MGSLELSNRLFQIFLRLYPAAFKERFASEMAQVFRSLSKEIYEDSGGTGLLRLWIDVLLDGLWALGVQWWLSISKRRADHLETNPMEQTDGARPLSPAQALLAALPFLLFGVSVYLDKFGPLRTWNQPIVRQNLFMNPSFLFDWLVLIGLFVGLLSGFPRWTYSYLGWAILFAYFYNGGFSYYGYPFVGQSWLILLGVFLLAIFIKRSLKPLRDLVSGLWEEWTLASLAIYILAGFVLMIFDENHHPYLGIFIITTALAISLGAWGYFRARTPLRRELALIGGTILGALLNAINSATWDWRAYYGFPEESSSDVIGLIIFVIIFAFLFLGNGALARWRNKRMKQAEA
ncbi:MAG TPA: hypothetical protein VE136_11475 [Anaerolineales bacterium]|nr:hypothetical protein [Anaerolineales bacterium]